MKPVPITTDEIIARLCEALNDGMDKFEARDHGNRYKNLIEKHWGAASKSMLERESEVKQDLDMWRRPR